MTDNFIKKYGYEEDIIKYDTPIYFKLEDGSNFDNRIFSFSINMQYQNKKVQYRYKFNLDNHDYLDDIELINQAEVINENTQKLKYNVDILDYAIIKNSDWSRCPFSDKFLNKYNSQNGLFQNYDFISTKVESVKDNTIGKLLVRLYDVNNHYKKCLFKFIWNANKEIDDILTYMITDDKINYQMKKCIDLLLIKFLWGYVSCKIWRW